MRKLDEIALNIELVLISIIEGVALSALGYNAIPVFAQPANWQYIPFVFAGLAILLVFWSQAILHAVSFIRWPLSMGHMLTYFLASFLQVIAYYNITTSTSWFLWWTIFSFLAFAIYIIDLRILKSVVPNYDSIPGGPSYIQEVLRRHVYEMKFLIPLSVAFNVVVLGLAFYGGPYFSGPMFCIVAGTVQLLVSLGALMDCVKNFKSRSAMLPALFGE